MTAAEQQISGNPAAMENAQARTTVTDQAKVQDIISRMGSARVFAHFGLRPSPWR